MSSDEDVLSDEQREAWPSAEPPDGFAARVMARRAEELAESTDSDVTPPGRESVGFVRSTAWIAAVAVVLLALPLVWWLSRGPAEGSLMAQTRRSASLGSRAVVVAEAGASLRWRVEPNGSARVQQDAGRVFYRVDEGEHFEVVTPHGTVHVLGTCFTVEMNPMNEETNKTMGRASLRSGVLGAALASAVVVTVYEGRVAVAGEGPEVTVDAGQRARAGQQGWSVDETDPSASRPSLGAGSDPDSVAAAASPVTQLRRQAKAMERLRAANEAQREQIETLQEQLGEAPVGGEAQERARTCAKEARAEGCSIADPEPETLLELARCGAVQVDIPGFLEHGLEEDIATLAGDWGQQMGLSDEETEQLYSKAEDFREARFDALRALLAEVGDDPDIADALPDTALSGAIEAQFDREEFRTVRRRLSRERAGLESPPQDVSTLSPTERYARLKLEIGNDFESAVAEALGPAQAHALRSAEQGWPGGTSIYSGTCDDE